VTGEADPWDDQVQALGSWLQTQRKLAQLSLRQLADLTEVSSTYLSQIERGLHEPSMRVIKSIAEALGVTVEAALAQMGLVGDEIDGPTPADTESAIRADPVLSNTQKEALLAVYRSYLAQRLAADDD
jgi:transcriptional regulator with XRE-family HTH domain